MSHGKWLEFFLLNLSAAAAIAIDACVLVISKFRQFHNSLVAIKWASAVGFTHVVFPLFGFIGGWILIERYHVAPLVYSVGAFLLAFLVVFVVRESTKVHAEDEGRVRERAGFLAFWIPVLSVSLDALLAGPGKTVLLERYPKNLAWLSFVLVGGLVAVFTLGAGFISTALHHRWISRQTLNADSISNFLTFGVVLEITLFSFFGVWSVSKAVEYASGQLTNFSFENVLVAGLGIGAVLALCFLTQIRSAQHSRVSAMLERKAVTRS
jgi:uncharacterized membrane protein YfcA